MNSQSQHIMRCDVIGVFVHSDPQARNEYMSGRQAISTLSCHMTEHLFIQYITKSRKQIGQKARESRDREQIAHRQSSHPGLTYEY